MMDNDYEQCVCALNDALIRSPHTKTQIVEVAIVSLIINILIGQTIIAILLCAFHIL